MYTGNWYVSQALPQNIGHTELCPYNYVYQPINNYRITSVYKRKHLLNQE